MRSKETDPRRIAQRRKQIYLGKSTSGYSSYTTTVPKGQRRADLAFSKHPITPDPQEKCSKRRFDGKLRVWRRGIHSFEEDVDSGGMLSTAVVGVRNDSAPTAGPSSLPVLNNRSLDKTSRVCSDQHTAIAKDTKKESGAPTKSVRNIHDKALALAKNSARPKSGFSVVVSGLSPIQENVPAKRYTFDEATTAKKGSNESGATAKFETPRKKIRGKTPLIRPGSSGKENFAVSRSAKKRALQQLQEANGFGFAAATTINPALLANGVGSSSYPTFFDKMSARFAMGDAGSTSGGVMCTGGVCKLPSAYDDGSKTHGSRRVVLGELCENVHPRGTHGNAYTKLEDTHFDILKKETQIPAAKRRPLEEFLRMHDAANVNVDSAAGVGRATQAHIPGISKSEPMPPKCARFNEGVCDLSSARCEYRHAVWTFAERVEYEARRAFAENSRVLEQNSALLNRLREQDLLIADQSQEISSLLDEVHRLRHSALRHRGTTLTTPSRAATIAATALRRTPLRSASSRASFRTTANAPRTPMAASSIVLRGGGNDDASVSAIDNILYGNSVQRPSIPESTTYESIHAGARFAKGPRGAGFGTLA